MTNTPTLVLIDDDELIQATWKLVAKEKGHEIECFSNERDFSKASIEKNIPIYIDYHFRSGETGVDIVKTLHEQGYHNLFITTGSLQPMINVPSEIQEIVGKDYPL